MELFSEIYSAYFRAMEDVLTQAQQRPLRSGELQKILSERTFLESAVTILPKLESGDWPLLQKTDAGFLAALPCLPALPLTALQKAWLRALLDDPRFQLFFESGERTALLSCLQDVEPLYRQEDFYVFDQASDGDDYASLDYQAHFRLILAAIHEKGALHIQYEGAAGSRVVGVFRPLKLEYSPKDDKFRAYCIRIRKAAKRQMVYTLNLGRITAISPIEEIAHTSMQERDTPQPSPRRQVTIEITKERNALERCMVQFAHFEKRTEYDEACDTYTCTIWYHVLDETELVIRILSFGPTIKVLAPEAILSEIRKRIAKQTAFLKQAES